MSTPTFFSLKTKIALTITVVLWSSAFVGIRMGLEGYAPGSLALLRFMIASVFMLFFYLRLPKRVRISTKDTVLLLLLGAGALGGYNVFLNYGEITIPSGIASFIVSQGPLITLLLAVMFLGEQFKWISLGGILISIFGVGLIAVGESDNFKFDIGMLYVLIATIFNGCYSVLQKPFLSKYHAIEVTVYILWGTTLGLLFFLPDVWRDVQTAPLHATLAVVYLGIFPAGVAYIAWSYALAEIPASRCVSFLYFMPIIATLLGWLFMDEVPALLSLGGGLIALSGVWIVNRAYRQKKIAKKLTKTPYL